MTSHEEPRGTQGSSIARTRLPLFYAACSERHLVGWQVNITTLRVPWFDLDTTGSAAKMAITDAVLGMAYVPSPTWGDCSWTGRVSRGQRAPCQFRAR